MWIVATLMNNTTLEKCLSICTKMLFAAIFAIIKKSETSHSYRNI